MKKVLIVLITVIIAALPISAEVKTYEDEFVSFDYDDSALNVRAYHFYPGTMYEIKYSRDESMIFANAFIMYMAHSKSWDYMLNEDPWVLRRGHEFVTEDEDVIRYYKVLAKDSYGYLFMIMETNDVTSNVYDVCTLTYDSAKCTELFRNKGFAASDDYSKAR